MIIIERHSIRKTHSLRLKPNQRAKGRMVARICGFKDLAFSAFEGF